MIDILSKTLAYLFIAFIVVAIVGGVSALSGFVFWVLWNAVVPVAFGGPVLSFYAAWALSALLGFVAGIFRRSTQASK